MVSELVKELREEAAEMERRAARNSDSMIAVHQEQTAAHLLIGAAICQAIQDAADDISSSIDLHQH